ncbi:MAG TPA: hypothetical protein VJ579_04575 [Candidatus Paceibacterota bacterium]|nr:hypothetical protein [Candidatus Paceibacterota bacterium]
MHTLVRQYPAATRSEASQLWTRFESHFSAEHNKFVTEELMVSIVLRVAAEIIVRDLSACECINAETNVLAQQVLACKNNVEVYSLYESDKEAFDNLIFMNYMDDECKGDVADAVYAEVHCRALSLLLDAPEVSAIPPQLHEDIVEMLNLVKG